MIRVENLEFSYGNVKALFGVSLEAAPGRITCVMGRNGVGKTTLMRNILGLLQPSGGKILFDGRDVTGLPSYRRVRLGMAFVPQGRQIFPRLTVEENLRIGLASRRHDLPPEVFDYFPVLGEMRRRMGGDLSGGQQQQLAIARALVTHPRLLVLDEPTEGIQPNIIQNIGRILRDLSTNKGMTILLVEQYLDFVRTYADHFFMMNRGAVAASGPVTELDEDVTRRYLNV
jgi:urea transport system ATP-binding protein